MLTIWWCPCVESSLVFLEEGICCDQCILLAKLSLCPASFCTSRPNFPVTPGVSWLPTFAFQSPIMKKTSFLGVILKGLVGLHRTVQLQVLRCYWLGHRPGFPWYWMVRLFSCSASFVEKIFPCLLNFLSISVNSNWPKMDGLFVYYLFCFIHLYYIFKSHYLDY